jgi:hypothetical protein
LNSQRPQSNHKRAYGGIGRPTRAEH